MYMSPYSRVQSSDNVSLFVNSAQILIHVKGEAKFVRQQGDVCDDVMTSAQTPNECMKETKETKRHATPPLHTGGVA